MNDFLLHGEPDIAPQGHNALIQVVYIPQNLEENIIQQDNQQVNGNKCYNEDDIDED